MPMGRNTYEEKQERRRQRYEERAERAAKNAEALAKRARDMASIIPFGQPILIGHHSEKRDRNYRAKINRTFERASEEASKAAYYAGKAASVGLGGVSADDPDAIDKLGAQLAERESNQAMMRAANRVIHKFHKAGCRGPESENFPAYVAALRAVDPVVDEAAAAALLKPDAIGRIGFPDYKLKNNNAQIRRLKGRIAQLKRASDVETSKATHETHIGPVTVTENAEENRLQITFPCKPPADVIAELKSRGFRWSRFAGAWQRQLNNGARYAAKCVLRKLGVEAAA